MLRSQAQGVGSVKERKKESGGGVEVVVQEPTTKIKLPLKKKGDKPQPKTLTDVFDQVSIAIH